MNWSLYQSLIISNFDNMAILQEKLVFFAHNYTHIACPVLGVREAEECWGEGVAVAAGVVVDSHQWSEPVDKWQYT